MKKDEIKIGTTYMAKVTNKVVPVKITRESPHGGGDAVNTATGKTIRIKSAARLRKEATVGQITNAKITKAPDAPAATAKSKAGKNAKAKADADATLAALNPAFVGGKASRPRKRVSKTTKPAPANAGGRKRSGLSLLDRASVILGKATAPMNCKAIVVRAIEGGWTTSGKTPHATLNAAMIREIAKKGDESRFKKVGRGMFAAA